MSITRARCVKVFVARRFIAITLLPLGLVLGTYSPLFAEQYVQTLVRPRSRAQFSLTTPATSLSGSFNSYSGTLRIDIVDPTRSKIDFLLDASDVALDRQSPLGFLSFDQLFRAIPNPRVQFTSTNISALPDRRYLVSGTVLQGSRNQKVELPVRLEQATPSESIVTFESSGTMREGNPLGPLFARSRGTLNARLLFSTRRT